MTHEGAGSLELSDTTPRAMKRYLERLFAERICSESREQGTLDLLERVLAETSG